MASLSTRQPPSYSAAAFSTLNAIPTNLSSDAFPVLTSAAAMAQGRGADRSGASEFARSASQAELSYQQHALLLAREQHRANVFGNVNNDPSTNAPSLLQTLNEKRPPEPGEKAVAVASFPPGIGSSSLQSYGASPRTAPLATVDAIQAQAAVNAVQSALDLQGAQGSVPSAQGPITQRAVEAAQSALDAATSTPASAHRVMVSGPGSAALLAMLPPSARDAVETISAQANVPEQQAYLNREDRFGLTGLLSIIKSQGDASLLSMGTDLRQMGLNLTSGDPLSTSFLTPWPDDVPPEQTDPSFWAQAHMQTRNMVEPDFYLPFCYNVQPPPPAHTKMRNLTDTTLFFIFYSAPRDLLQKTAAQELYHRGWRYHKTLRMWLTKDPSTEPIQKTAQFERSTYIFFDPGPWDKVSKLFNLSYDALAEPESPTPGLISGLFSSRVARSPLVAGIATSSQHSVQPHPSQWHHASLGQYPSPTAFSTQASYGLAHAQAVHAHALV